MKKDSFKVVVDADGHMYLEMTFNESDKTHHGIDSREQNKAPRMYSTESETCPVKAYEKYLDKLNPECEALFQKPLTKFEPDSPVLYGQTPAGDNHLYALMARLSGRLVLARGILTTAFVPLWHRICARLAFLIRNHASYWSQECAKFKFIYLNL